MIYKKFQDIQLSALGFGAMRMPMADGRIDMAHVEKMVAHAISQGVNYFDTAWGYHDGNSEIAIGQVLKAYPRDSFYLATKFPGFDTDNMTRIPEIFEKQLEKCQVEYFDFYLFHSVTEGNIDLYLDGKYGLFDYLMEQKARGRIRHLGFSCHGSEAVLRRFLDRYGRAIEFCQLQINWLDWEFQSAREKYALLREYQIPVWIMEPLRGGKLCRISPEDEAKLKALRPQETVTAWAFRFLQGLPEVKMILSGMSDLEQMEQNTATFATDAPLTDTEQQTLLGIAADMIAGMALPCTGCGYCTAKCPRCLDIPRILELYNGQDTAGGLAMGEDAGPAACIGCRSCEKVCPQGIRISETMKSFEKLLKDC